MGHFYFLLALAGGLFALFLLSVRKSLRSRYRLDYVADSTLFDPEQLAFRAVLERAVGKERRVYGKVRVADVVAPRPGLSRRDQERAYERLGERCFDFLVCDAVTSAIVCAVNLMPRSRIRRALGRDKLDRVCAAARLPFLRWRESDAYSVAEVEKAVAAVMRTPGLHQQDAVPPTVDVDVTLHGLSETIRRAERPAAPSRSGQPRTASGSASRREGGASHRPNRRDPVILGQDEIDDGPVFRIDGDLDEIRPLRHKRS